MQFPENEKPKMKKGRLAIILGAVALVLVAALILSWGSLEGLLASSKSPEEYLVYVEDKAQAEGSALDVATVMYGAFRKSMTEPAKNGAEGAVFLSVGEDLTGTLEQLLGGSLELDWLKQISVHTTVNNAGKIKGLEAALGLNGKPVLSADTVWDTENYDAYIRVPELNETYLTAGATDLGVDKQTIDDALKQADQLRAKLAELLPDQKVVKDLVSKYTHLVLAKLESVERTKESFTINGITQEFTVLQTQLSEQLVKDIALAVLAEAKNDRELFNLLHAAEAMAVAAEGNAADADVTTFESYQQNIDEMIADLNEETVAADAAYTFKTYVDKNHDICGRSITDADSGDEFVFLTVSDGSKWAFEMKFDEDVKLSGSGIDEKKLLTGTYEVRESGEVLLTIEAEKLDMVAMSEGELLGTFRLRLSQELLTELVEEADLEAVTLAGDVALELKLTEETCDINILNGGKLFLGMGITAAFKELEALTLPENAVALSDSAALEQWAGEADLQGILDALREAGVPEAYMNALESVTG